MSAPGLVVDFTTRFMEAVHASDAYFQTRNPTRGQRFAHELFTLLYDVVAVFPRSQP